jgi:hypothetical protein
MKNILRENMRRFKTKNLLKEQIRTKRGLYGVIKRQMDTYNNNSNPYDLNEIREALKLLTTIKDELWKIERRFYLANKKVNSAPNRKAEYDAVLEEIFKFFDTLNYHIRPESNWFDVITPLFRNGTDIGKQATKFNKNMEMLTYRLNHPKWVNWSKFKVDQETGEGTRFDPNPNSDWNKRKDAIDFNIKMLKEAEIFVKAAFAEIDKLLK